MTNGKTTKKKTILFIFFYLILGLFMLNSIKTINSIKAETTGNNTLKAANLNTVIQGVAISRSTEIKINGIKEWQKIDGSTLKLTKNQTDPADHFLKGDSIVKKKNSDTFIIVRDKQRFTWILP